MNVSRRRFLKLGGSAAAAGPVSLAFWGQAGAATAPIRGETTLDYPERTVTRADDLRPGRPVSFTYPDPQSPCQVIKTGERVAGGVGPDGDIVAYSVLCTHMGCGVQYDAEAGVFKCPCHFSMFDPAREGQQVCGQATVDLPRIQLAYAADSDTLTAVGVLGLIYGRQSNILPEA